MKNVIKEALEELGLTQKEFSLQYGLSVSTVRFAVSGRLGQVPADVKNALKKSGYSIDELDEKYLRFKLWKAKQDLRLFQKRMKYLQKSPKI